MRLRNIISKITFFSLIAILFALSVPARAALPDTLVIALDGIPYALVREAQANGEFQDFYPASKMISTFPSLSDVAWDDIFHCDTPLGYQRIHFSPEQNKVVGKFVNELIHPEEYELRFDSAHYSTIHYVLIYVMSSEMARKEVVSMQRDFFMSQNSDVFFTFIEATDPVMHKYGKAQMTPFLEYLDKTLVDMQKEYFNQTGKHLKIIMLSDHGNTMVKGKTIPIKSFLRERGYIPANELKGPNYVAWTASGIVSSAVLYTYPETRERLANDLIDMEGVELATYDKDGVQYAINKKGMAKIYYDPVKRRGRYEIVTGDPIDYGPVMAKAKDMGWMDSEGFVPEETLLSLTSDHEYPDAIWRIYFCFNGAVAHTASVVLSLSAGHEFANETVKSLAKMSRRNGTHGGLSQINSAGFMISNFTPTETVNADHAARYFDATEFVRKEHKGSVHLIAMRLELTKMTYLYRFLEP